MSEAVHTLAQLRRTLLLEEERTHGRIALGHEGADAILKGGLQRGALHEVFADEGHAGAAIGFAALLAGHVSQGKPLLWIRQDFAALEYGEIAGSGIGALGFDPNRLLILRVSDATSALRAASDALSCAALGATLIEISGNPKVLDLTASRRLTLAATVKGVTAILLDLDAKVQASAAETRWLVRAGHSSQSEEDWGKPRFDARLLRNRHGGLGRWAMEWDPDHDCFRNPAKANSRSLAAASSDGPAQAQILRRAQPSP
jgi:protein ImuA